jgi:dTDP-glucose 4,6-dehydratase
VTRGWRKVVVTGGAGFLGSHLVDRMLQRGAEVVCVDNLVTGRLTNLAHLAADSRLEIRQTDVSEPLTIGGSVDAVLHFASPASPPDYMQHPVATLDVGTIGTRRMLDLAVQKGARFLMASTSEVYGDPQVHPQPESYWGNVNSIGMRSVYDEAKRASEAYVMAYHRAHNLDVRIARIFNTYGPRMRTDDGRAVPQFVTQALAGIPFTMYGDGSQTRSLCYVDDMVEGLERLLGSDYIMPVNLGNPHEINMLELAGVIQRACGSDNEIEWHPLPEDDPQRRCPDVTLAKELLDWEPKVTLEEGLRRTILWWRSWQPELPALPPAAVASR